MSDSNENKSYLNLVTEHIELHKLLYNLPPEKQALVKKLLEKRNSIHKANGIFAEYRINRINKKLYKIKNLKNMEHKN